MYRNTTVLVLALMPYLYIDDAAMTSTSDVAEVKRKRAPLLSQPKGTLPYVVSEKQFN